MKLHTKLIIVCLYFSIAAGLCCDALAQGFTRALNAKQGGSVVEYYHGDHLGSTSVMTNAAGELVRLETYQAYGQSEYQFDRSKFEPSHRYTDQVYDQELGLYYYNARYYDSELARFVQADSIIPDASDPQSYNRYSYVLNNPLKFVDPTGHSPGLAVYLTRLGAYQAQRRMQALTAARLAVLHKAGFTGEGPRVIVDSSVGTRGGPTRLAQLLRDNGYDAKSVQELFGRDPKTDVPIKTVADVTDAHVLANDKGADLDGGFFERTVRVDGRVRDPATAIRVLENRIGSPNRPPSGVSRLGVFGAFLNLAFINLAHEQGGNEAALSVAGTMTADAMTMGLYSGIQNGDFDVQPHHELVKMGNFKRGHRDTRPIGEQLKEIWHGIKETGIGIGRAVGSVLDSGSDRGSCAECMRRVYGHSH